MANGKDKKGNASEEFAGANDNRRTAGRRNNDPAPIQKSELIAAIKNKLPAYGARSFKIGDEEITPTKNQTALMNLIDTKTIVFVNGPFGTGKTFWTCLAALNGLAEGKYNKISLTAPAVEADEKIGFLPGTADDKLAVHVNQIIETIEDLVGKQACQNLRDAGMLEIAPHGFNRGRTYKKTIYIIDESQNATGKQLMTSIGRLGYGSTFVYMGDDKQNDRTNATSAYIGFVERFNKAAYEDDIGAVTMTLQDVRRHPLLQKIVKNNDHLPL